MNSNVEKRSTEAVNDQMHQVDIVGYRIDDLFRLRIKRTTQPNCCCAHNQPDSDRCISSVNANSSRNPSTDSLSKYRNGHSVIDNCSSN